MADTTAPEKRQPEAYATEEMTALLNEWARRRLLPGCPAVRAA